MLLLRVCCFGNLELGSMGSQPSHKLNLHQRSGIAAISSSSSGNQRTGKPPKTTPGAIPGKKSTAELQNTTCRGFPPFFFLAGPMCFLLVSKFEFNVITLVS